MRALKWIGGTVLILFVLIALFFTFGLNLLKGPITRAVTEATGRELVIEGDLRPVWSWVHPRIRAEGVTLRQRRLGQGRLPAERRRDRGVDQRAAAVRRPRGAARGAPAGRRAVARAGRRRPQELDPEGGAGGAEEGIAPLRQAAHGRRRAAALGRRLARAQLRRRPLHRRDRRQLHRRGHVQRHAAQGQGPRRARARHPRRDHAVPDQRRDQDRRHRGDARRHAHRPGRLQGHRPAISSSSPARRWRTSTGSSASPSRTPAPTSCPAA